MKFWPTFFGSLHRPATYVDARLIHRGYGIRYSFMLLVLVNTVAIATLLATTTFTTPTLHDIETVAVIFGLSLVMRAAILIPLVIAARLIGYGMKLRLSNAEAARLTAIAYTPVTLADSIAFFATGALVTPPVLFGCGIMMLLAAVYVAK